MITNIFKTIWKSKVWLFVSLITLIIVFTATLFATQNDFLSNTISTVMGGERRVLVSGDPTPYIYYTADNKNFKEYETDSDFGSKGETLKEANKLNEMICEEGFVLLKNDNNALPIDTSGQEPKVSVFGKNSVSLVYGGSGSGGGNTNGTVKLYDSLTAAGFDCNPTLKSFYESNRASGNGRDSNPDMGSILTGLATGETAQSRYMEDIKKSYAIYNDAAFVIISRIGGEGFDLPRTMVDANGRTISGANKNDHYLELDNNEKDMLSAVCGSFDKVVLIINCATSMELGFLDDGSYDIDAAIWIGSPGGSGINALGRILNGEVNPSGRLVDTYARDFSKDPTWANFSNNMVEYGNRYTSGGSVSDYYFVEYEESIYVGYRYYETLAYTQYDTYDDEEWYGNNVVYPFGYGMSYTRFNWEITEQQPSNRSMLLKDGEITITVKVTNTGDRPGKDVVQLYYRAPYYSQIEKPFVELGAYKKTKLLQPEESQTLELTLKVSDMASYDYNDANINGFSGYELEDGNYYLYIGRNAHDCWNNDFDQILYGVPLTEDENAIYGFLYKNDPVTNTEVINRFDDVSAGIAGDKYMTRRDFESSKPSAPTAAERNKSGEFIDSLTWISDDENMPYYVEEGNRPATGWKPVPGETAYKLYDLVQYDKEDGLVKVDYDDNEKWDNILDQITIDEMANLIGMGNFNTRQIDSIAKPKTTDPDGPAGFTNFMGDPTVYNTCFYASECVVAATWNNDVAHDMGIMVGNEGIWGNAKGDGRPYSGWYAPACNIHRSPFSGRNWEYYSEDPVLSGKMGANVVQGAKKKGVYTYIKHFALNDQETNRDTNGILTWANEQTIREIYLKPFEIIVKEGQTTAMMSSFNRIGKVWAGGSYELLTEVLRNEWGFRGMVITDYNLYDHMPADQMIRAGGDLNLVQDKKPTTANASATQLSLMRQATKNILYTVAGSNAMNGIGDGVVYRYAMPMWQIWLIILNVGLLVVFGVWGFFLIRYKLKKQKETTVQ